MTQTTKHILEALRSRLEGIYGERLTAMVLFGSHARSDADAESDIDVLVVLEPPVDPSEEIARTGETVASLCLENDVVIACVFVDTRSYETRQWPLLRNVRSEGVPV